MSPRRDAPGACNHFLLPLPSFRAGVLWCLAGFSGAMAQKPRRTGPGTGARTTPTRMTNGRRTPGGQTGRRRNRCHDISRTGTVSFEHAGRCAQCVAGGPGHPGQPFRTAVGAGRACPDHAQRAAELCIFAAGQLAGAPARTALAECSRAAAGHFGRVGLGRLPAAA